MLDQADLERHDLQRQSNRNDDEEALKCAEVQENVNELISLIDWDTEIPAIDITAFPKARCGHYCSSTPVAGKPEFAWSADFDHGKVGTSRHSNTDKAYYIPCAVVWYVPVGNWECTEVRPWTFNSGRIFRPFFMHRRALCYCTDEIKSSIGITLLNLLPT